LAASGFHAQACFWGQQCAEKAAKAMWLATGDDPWGHSIQALIDEFTKKDSLEDSKSLREKAAVLDRFYIPTRYPNGLPDLTPHKTYFAADSQQAIEVANDLLETFAKWVKSWK
jgi:HEPN domain-containing protein